jgi:hypothetical protein
VLAKYEQEKQRELTRELNHNGLPRLSKIHTSRKQYNFQSRIDSIHAMVEQFSKRTALARSPSIFSPSDIILSHLHLKPTSIGRINVRLTSIHCVKGLVHKQPNGPTSINPTRTILVQRRTIPEHSQEIDDHEGETGERNLPHPQNTKLVDIQKGSCGLCIWIHASIARGVLPHWVCRKSVSKVSWLMWRKGDIRHRHGKTFDNDMSVERLENISRHQTVVDGRILVLLELGQVILPYVHHLFKYRREFPQLPCQGRDVKREGKGVKLRCAQKKVAKKRVPGGSCSKR